MVRFGGNEFTAFSVPLAFAGRYFLVEPGTPPLVSVVTEHEGEVRFEVVKNHPGDSQSAKIETNPTGIVIVSKSGGFIYKIRPESETSVAFGRLSGEDELEVRISDRRIRIVRIKPGGETVDTITLQANMFGRDTAGIVLEPNGRFTTGGPIPDLVRRAFGLDRSQP